MANAQEQRGDLLRQIGFFTATVLVISNMIGTGIFTTSGLAMQELEDPLMLLLCWLCGGLFALCGALCYGELGAKFPRAGGEYVFLRESFGGLSAFLSGWISLVVGFSAPIAAAAIAFATYAFSAFGLETGTGTGLEIFGFQVARISYAHLVAVGVVIVFSLLHYHSISAGSRIQNLLTLTNFGLILIFITAGLTLGEGTSSHLMQAKGISTFSAEAFAVSMVFVYFAYSGWNAAAYLGGEISSPQRNIPLSLIVGTLTVMALYLLLNLVYVYSMSVEQMKGVIEVGALSAKSLFGAQATPYFSLAVAIGILSAISAMVMTGPRIYYAMSRDGVFFTGFSRVDPERRTPSLSIILQAAIACIMIITSTFDALLMYIGFTLSIFSMLAVIGLMKIRITRPEIVSRYKTPGYPLTPLLFIGVNIWIIYHVLQSRPISSLFGIATIALGVAVYACFSCRRQQAESGATG